MDKDLDLCRYLRGVATRSLSGTMLPSVASQTQQDGLSSGKPVLDRASEPGQRLAQRVEAEGTQIQRVPVEGLEVEVGTLSVPRLVPGLHPDALTDLVRRRLSRPAQVTLPLEAQHLLGHPGVRPQELPAQLRCPAFAGTEAERVVPRDLQLEVHADVDDHPRRAQRLTVQHAQPVARIRQVAEIVHEPLGVQGPALPVPGAPAEQPLPAVEQIGAEQRLADLQVMAGYALVVDGGDLTPGG